MPDAMRDPQLGISLRFVQRFDMERAQRFTHEDAVRFLQLQACMAEHAERLELEHRFALPSPPERADV